MRFLLVACALSVAACIPRAESARCDVSATFEVAFTAPDAVDTITAETIGPACDKAIGLYVIRDSEGVPLWSWSAPLMHRFGDVFEGEDTEHVQNFVDRWAQASLSSTQSAPAFDALAQGASTLDQLTYEDIRARDLPMLCHYSGTGTEICIFWEPAAGGAGLLLERDAVEEAP
jgi:hypothetical protein